MTYASKDYIFLKKWKKHQRNLVMTIYPHLPEEEVDKVLEDMIDKSVTVQDATIQNTYVHKTVSDNLLGVLNWVENSKPILAGFGVFFKDHNKAANPAAIMLQNFMDLRNKYKAQLKNHKETSYEYLTFDRLQGSEKVNANSFYGASGAPTSNFFNLFSATSVTATGQSLISTTQQAFEALLANNNPFIDLDECLNYLENIRKEKWKLDSSFLPKVDVNKVLDRLSTMFYDYDDERYEPILALYLLNQGDEYLKRLYYKNNIYEFSFLPKIRGMLRDIASKVDEFKDPNKIPKVIESELEQLWKLYKEFVVYNHAPFDRIKRLKNDKRKAVVIVDTDSNFINLNPWVIFMNNFIIKPDPVLAARPYDTMRFISINTMCYIITMFIETVLYKYTKDANIPKDYRSKISMKNEYLLSRLIIANTKKRYGASARLREGKEFSPEKIELKGYDFAKTTTRPETRDYFQNILKNRILQAEEIDVGLILKDMEIFKSILRESLEKGEKSYLIPKSVKEVSAYSDPMTQQGFRGVIAWNLLYPDTLVTLPEKLDIVKVKFKTLKDLEALKPVQPEYYEILKANIFENKNIDLASKGVSVIAIPRQIPKIPEWLIPFIDYETIITDNMKKFDSVLESLGLLKIKSTKYEFISNILLI